MCKYILQGATLVLKKVGGYILLLGRGYKDDGSKHQ
jgi:hypothetical protein